MKKTRKERDYISTDELNLIKRKSWKETTTKLIIVILINSEKVPPKGNIKFKSAIIEDKNKKKSE
jgi:hypothetical protein